jgi:phosphoglucomutase
VPLTEGRLARAVAFYDADKMLKTDRPAGSTGTLGAVPGRSHLLDTSREAPTSGDDPTMPDHPASATAHIQNLLADKHGALGQRAAAELARWLSGAILFAHPEVIARHLQPDRLPLLFDAFWQVLPFGTGGRRGKVGYGANRLNPATVAMTIQGHCNFLRQRFAGRSNLAVVVANDVRVFRDVAGSYAFLGAEHPLMGLSSRGLARLACEIYAGNGITAYLHDPDSDSATLSTPELSFVISRLGSAGVVGGVNMSASHNPPDDNGVKLYDEFGSQPVAPEDQQLLDIMSAVSDIRPLPFAQASAGGLVKAIPAELHHDYVEGYRKLYGDFFTPREQLPVVYTPLCGVGLGTVGDVLTAIGFPMLTPTAERPDGSFAVIPFRSPNPEVPQSTEPARAFADRHGSGLVLSSDPDADRVGCEIRLPPETGKNADKDAGWYHFDGNQIAAILTYALMLDPAGPRRKGLVIETLVTTKLLGKIVAARGESDLIDDLLVGFKYVADVLKRLGRDGRYRDVKRRPEELVLAAEESHGVIALPHILDKDATPACMYLAGLYQRLAAEGRTLLDYYTGILEQLGGFDTVNRSIMMAGAVGMQRKDRIMSWLRDTPPAQLAGHAVTAVIDHWDERRFGPLVSESERLPRNVIQLQTGRFVITVRPSGTEPKLKFYCQLLPDPAQPPGQGPRGRELLQAVRREADAAAQAIYNDLVAPLGVKLGPLGLALTDLIELDRKQEFERDTVPRLRQALVDGQIADQAQLEAWLRREAAVLLPGADPLPALRGPLGAAASAWARELPDNAEVSAGVKALVSFTGGGQA